jgi:Zn-finger nucleic acid-binding protein
MPANALNCPSCGATVTADETRCRYCSTRLARVVCPNCFGMMYVGSKFCAHCGVTLQATPVVVDEPKLICVDCGEPMHQSRLGATVIHECDRCHGLWIDTESFTRICAEHERQVDLLGAMDAADAAATTGPARVVPMVRYRACPVCKNLMNRTNFGRASKIVIDVCKFHGSWFDRDELRQIVEFIRSGGEEIAKQRQREHDAARERWNSVNRRSTADEFSWNHGRSGGTPL